MVDMKKKHADIHKTMMLEMQITRQEVIEEVKRLRASVTRMIESTTRRTNFDVDPADFNFEMDHVENVDDTIDDTDNDISEDESIQHDFLR